MLHEPIAAPVALAPDLLDPAGVPLEVDGQDASWVPSPRPTLPGLHPSALLVTAEAVDRAESGSWVLWGTLSGRPILFRPEHDAAVELLASLAWGEHPVAIVEPWQVLGQSLD